VFPDIHSGLYVPLKAGEQVIGSISVESEVEDAFTERDQRLLETLAGQAAIAIENANLFLMTQKEIIEREQAEAALQKKAEELLQLNNQLEQRVMERTAEIEVTRKRLELATDAAGLGIWEWNISNGSVIWDKQMFNIYGLSPQSFDGKVETQLKFIHPEDKTILPGVAKAITENKENNFKIEHRILRKDGTIRTLFEQGVAIFGQSGSIESIVGIANDITPQKQAEQDLHESEAYARLLFDAAPDPVSVAEVDGIMVDVNRLFEQQHQIQRKDVQGRHISELKIFPEEQLKKAGDYIAAIVEGKQVPPVELDFYPPGGGSHTLEMHSYPIEVKGRQLVLSTSRDITLHKKAEESLRAANMEMERALRMKDEFLANMSHELRTPLNAVLGMSESLEEQIAGPLNEKQLKYIGTIRESGKHLLELINDILDLSKIEAGRLELNVSQVSVLSLCEASLRMVKEQAQKKNQNVSLKIDPDVKVIMGDERRLKQSLVNLLSNAVKFTPNDRQVGVEVKGNVRNQTVVFTVWDEGIGMEQEDLDKIFKPFVQLDSGLSREFSGTGLGLVLVAQMIRLHGGSVSVESKGGQGSRFSFTLPWVDVEGSGFAQKIPQETESGSAPEKMRSGKILIVEDTDSIITLLSEYLRYRGYQILAARNGREGVTLAFKEDPDLILMDVMMPVMDGVEATRQIRAKKEFQKTPIIALTALAMQGDKERCLQAGMTDYISKPVQMKELESLILKHIRKTAPPS
ncbi:MAG: response regulator, partial [Anaerolineales bacterium]|nr:response regulator [Anaerolineales bacterium]